MLSSCTLVSFCSSQETFHLMRMQIFLFEIDDAAHALILHPIDIMLSAVVPSQIVHSGGDKTALVTSKLSNFSAAFYFRRPFFSARRHNGISMDILQVPF